MKKIAGILTLLILINSVIPIKAYYESGTSGEASKWQIDESISSSDLNCITYFKNKLYISAGSNGVIRTSSDSSNWVTNSEVQNNYPVNLYDIACSEEKIVIAGEKGTILCSENGSTWTASRPVTKYNIRKVICGGKTFLALTDKPGELLVWDAVSDWKVLNISKNKINDIIWNGNVFAAVGDKGGIYTSNNGVQWKEKLQKNSPSLKKIAWNGKMFLAFGTFPDKENTDYISGLCSATSKNGNDWSINPINVQRKADLKVNYFCSNPNIICTEKEFVITVLESSLMRLPDNYVSTYISKDGKKWSYSSFLKTDCSPGLHTLWDGKNIILAVNNIDRYQNYYSTDFLMSRDGSKWEQAYKLDGNNLDTKINDILYENGKFTAAGNSGKILSSEDFTRWEESKVIHIPALWDGKSFISIDKNNNIFASPDGLTWKKVYQYNASMQLSYLSWTGKEYIALCGYSVMTSKDLKSWKEAGPRFDNELYNSVGIINVFATDGTRFIISGATGTAVSKDKKTWTAKRFKPTQLYQSIIIGKNNYLALNKYGRLEISKDGLNWEKVNIKALEGSIKAMVYNGEKYISAGSDGAVFYSEDGTNWTKADSTVTANLLNAYWTGKEFYAAGNGRVISSSDGENWVQENIPGKYGLTFPDYQVPVIASGNNLILIYLQDKIIYRRSNG